METQTYPDTTQLAGRPPEKNRLLMSKLLQDRVYSLSITIVVVCIVASLVFPQNFPTFENLSQLLLNLSIDTIVAVGMMLLLIATTQVKYVLLHVTSNNP